MKQQEKILIGLIRAKGAWMFPKDFMKPDMGDLFVWYEATARLSEVARKYPNIIDTKQEGRFKARRFRVDCTVEDFAKLPSAVRNATARDLYLSGHGKCLHERCYRDGDRRVCAAQCGWSEPVTARV